MSQSIIPGLLQDHRGPNCGSAGQPGPLPFSRTKNPLQKLTNFRRKSFLFWSQLLAFQGPPILLADMRRLCQSFGPV